MLMTTLKVSQSQSSDPKVHVTWAKFERTDINDAVFFSEHMEINGNFTSFFYPINCIS